MPEEQLTAEPRENTIRFKNEYVLTKQKVRKQDRLSPKTSPVRFWFFLILQIFFAGAAVSALLSARISGAPIDLFYVIAPIFLVFFPLISYRIKLNREFKSVKQTTGEEKLAIGFIFGDDGITVKSCSASSTFLYDRIYYINEVDGCFYLWFEKTYWVIYKDSFTVGNADEFGAFIRKKCSEKKPLLTKKQLCVKHLKGYWLAIIIFVAMCAFVYPVIWSPVFHDTSSSIERVIAGFQKDHQVVTYVELEGGAVIFGAQGTDTIGATLFGKSGKRYVYADGHTYSITSIIRWSYDTNSLFESRDGLLTLSAGDWSVIYGVTDAQFWNGLYESDKSKYTAVEFRRGTGDFVLYYRVQKRSQDKNMI